MMANAPTVRWSKQWVPQDVISTGGKCSLLKWVTGDMLKSLEEKREEPEEQDLEHEPTEVLFLCSYEGCGKTFLGAGALRKHVQNHAEKQYICHYDGCGKKFVDSSKLKRHFLTHTGERHFICPYPGCGKAFSLDFNLRSHMKTHSPENYRICPYVDCGKKYTHENKLNAHIKAHHGKNAVTNTVKVSTPVAEKAQSMAKTVPGSSSCERPYVCPYEGCRKDYIHEYKLNLHLKREHPAHISVEENIVKNSRHTPTASAADEGSSEQEAPMKTVTALKNMKRNVRPSPIQQQIPPSKVAKHKGSISAHADIGTVKKQWPVKDMTYEEEDSEETEEDGGNGDDDDDGDEEETEDED